MCSLAARRLPLFISTTGFQRIWIFSATRKSTRSRDFIDLFFIVKKEGWSLDNLLKDARVKFDTHIDLVQFGTQLLKVETLRDLPRMLVEFDLDAVRAFFLKPTFGKWRIQTGYERRPAGHHQGGGV
ncbi:MAG: hypothetical protein Q8R13_02025 [bacterium]|nr:hypothetical protein [bacterium]MDZ4295950.1 hypothetical protein [Patescibacteria group bacterium]